VLSALQSRDRARKSATEYIHDGLESLSNLNELGALEVEDRREIRSVMYRLWLALREIEQGNYGTVK
jgi:hypothetical protein